MKRASEFTVIIRHIATESAVFKKSYGDSPNFASFSKGNSKEASDIVYLLNTGAFYVE